MYGFMKKSLSHEQETENRVQFPAEIVVFFMVISFSHTPLKTKGEVDTNLPFF